ncbi:MAG: PD-(D/E)XK nuclease family protein [Candidatus Aminicenantes bacterium]|nr:PD-(D/E)XK nuclease family protein [Candidatus Aminicenantes bacterium]
MFFLQKIADKFLKEYGGEIHKIAFVFPTRRAGLYFLRHLQKQKKETASMWAPPIFSIKDFAAGLAGVTIPDQLELIFALYEGVAPPAYEGGAAPPTYEGPGNHITDRIDQKVSFGSKFSRRISKEFADFYPWGKMIISDFDEIDKHLVDAAELFRNLKEFKEIEDINIDEQAGIYQRYTGFWEDLGSMYREFNRALKEKNSAYEGMAFRFAAENIKEILKAPADPKAGGGNRAEGLTATAPGWEKAVFCGFNALTPAEETIIRFLISEEKGEIFWDMDHYFVDDVNQEAGSFYRRNREFFGREQEQWVEDRLLEPKNIDIIGVQSKVSQAKVLGLKLEQLGQALSDPEHIAVVLPDETMLFPVLNSLPGNIEKVNITIGFPLAQTPVYSLFDSILEMQWRAAESSTAGPKAQPTKDSPGKNAATLWNSAPVFYYKDVRKIMNHPYIRPFATEEIGALMTHIKKENLIYMAVEDVASLPKPLKNLFKIPGDSRQIIERFQELLTSIRSFYLENKPGLFATDHEYLYFFYTLLTRLQDSLKNTGLQLDIRTFRQLLSDIVKSSRLPFTGEPLEGLQIMGVLETQTLNFSNLFILSVNEDYLPPGKSHHSFIPTETRKIIGLPTYKESDAVAAYHFYRLLKNSQNVTLIYTTAAGGLEKSEKSRFIEQLQIEYAVKNPQARIEHQVIDFSFSHPENKEIRVEKSAAILERLAERYYSASSLLDYLTCPLKFYFSHILKLKEEEEVFESPDQRIVGDIIHDVLHKLYGSYRGRDEALSFKEIETIQGRVEPVLTAVYRDTLKSGDLFTGRNRIVFEVIKQLLDSFFEKEKRGPGFKILMLEEAVKGVRLSFAADNVEYSVQLVGQIDRVDIAADNTYRIIDYKTGKVNSLSVKDLEELSGAKAAERREVFQLFFYRYLLSKRLAGDERNRYRLGIYPFKKMYEELKFVCIDKSDVIGPESVDCFEQVLIDIFRELFDPGVPFSPTEEEKNCGYCPYRNLCGKSASDY